MDFIGVKEEKKRLIGRKSPQEGQSPLKRLLYVSRLAVGAVVEFVKPPAKAVVSPHVAALRMSCRSISFPMKRLRKRFDPLGQHISVVMGKDPVLAWIKACKDGHMGRQSSRQLHHRVLEKKPPFRQAVKERTGLPVVAIAAQMIRP